VFQGFLFFRKGEENREMKSKMYYIQSNSTDPYYNLALEQHVFDKLDRSHSYFMLWQNDNAIIVGKHQNTIEEINAAYVKEKGITVARRLSGGGAVYHDLGNINFTFIVDDNNGKPFDFATFCVPVVQVLASMGVKAEISGRNDMTIDGKKFSGNSQYSKQGRVMHHGTILYDSDLQVVSKALNVSVDKIESKGIKSVRSRVTNVRPYVSEDIPTTDFLNALRDFMFKENDMQPYELTEEDERNIRQLRDEVYSRWEWNYGKSPAHTIWKARRVEGCGKLEIFINMAKSGIIEDIAFYGDFFSNLDPAGLSAVLKGCFLEEESLRTALTGTSVGKYINNLTVNDFVSIMLQ